MKGKYQILVDSSVWIDFFRNSKQSQFEEFLKEDLVVTNEIILCELLPQLYHLGKMEAADAMENLQIIPLSIDWQIICKYQEINLKNGIDKVGIPDLIILQQVINEKLILFSLDKHFKLMSDNFYFDLLPA